MFILMSSCIILLGMTYY